MFDNIISLFNYSPVTDSWAISIIEGVDFHSITSSTKSSQGTKNTDTVELIINCSGDKVIKTREGKKQYITPSQYAKAESTEELITFTPETDFIMEGDFTCQEPLIESEYEEGLYQFINKEYDGVYMIASSTFLSLIPHFEIGGR